MTTDNLNTKEDRIEWWKMDIEIQIAQQSGTT